jgi:hypothetical protein
VERAVKVQEVNFAAMAKKITWWQAAESIGFSDRKKRVVPKVEKTTFPSRAWKSPKDAGHFPTASAAAAGDNETGPFPLLQKADILAR